MRITKEALDELIEHGGMLKHGPINATGVLRLALDLRDARARIAELEEASQHRAWERDEKAP